MIDDPLPADAPLWYTDADRDDYGDPSTGAPACEPAGNQVADNTDCDDGTSRVNPGERETPYDGIDQDCSGADVIDVDGDGYVAVAAGGDDCDDEDPAAWPGAIEDLANPGDEDCDGLINEHTVCWDGTGEFLTIQSALDAGCEGVEVCPGTYDEAIFFTASVGIGGAGTLPREVVITNPDRTAGFNTSTPDLDIRLQNFELGGDNVTIYLGDAANVVVDRIAAPSAEVSIYIAHLTGRAHVEHCHFGADAGLVVWDAAEGAEVWFRWNLLEGGQYGSGVSLSGEEGSFVGYIENNLAVGMPFGASTSDYWHLYPTIYFRNNTIVGGRFALAARDPATDFRVTDNIVADADGVDWIDYVYTSGEAPRCPHDPTEWARNVLWNVDEVSSTLTTYIEADGALSDIVTEDCGGVSTVNLDSTYKDPLFVPDALMGSYALDPASPAVDAGERLDPDGSPSDLGAFGGPGGDWYLDVPWAMP